MTAAQIKIYAACRAAVPPEFELRTARSPLFRNVVEVTAATLILRLADRSVIKNSSVWQWKELRFYAVFQSFLGSDPGPLALAADMFAERLRADLARMIDGDAPRPPMRSSSRPDHVVIVRDGGGSIHHSAA